MYYFSVCLYGGAPRDEQIRLCRNGVEIIIATPGRLADLAAAGVICLATVSYVVSFITSFRMYLWL